MRTFLAVLFSHLMERERSVLRKSIAFPIPYTIQFSSGRQISSHGRELAHSMVIDTILTEEDIGKIHLWYTKFNSSQEEGINRLRTCSQYIQKAITERDDIDQFIHYFISVDDLFGIRGAVEESIKSGIRKVFGDDNEWVQKAECLFDLRSDLVHGGSGSIGDWNRLERYIKYFKSEPLEDITVVALISFRKYFD